MCGIAGLVLHSDRSIDPRTAAAVSASLAPRGPDDTGYLGLDRGGAVRSGRDPEFVENATTGLIHRRLAIIDPGETGWQPMSTPDGRFHLVYNGEVYNYVELRGELEPEGVAFRGRCDAEVLLRAFERWGTACLPRLTGMFAFAVLDVERRTITLARDGFGIKPLYYSRFEGGFAFASEIKALMALPGVSRRVDPQRMYDYLRFSRTDAEPRTLFAGVDQLMPGHFAVLPLDGSPLETACYWKLQPEPRNDLSYRDAADELRGRFLDSVRLHLRSDVPVGTCLSGGIDSSAIVMAMRHLLGPEGEIHTFSYVPGDGALSEERWIDIVNEAAGAVPHKVRPRHDELVRDLDGLIWAQDEPFAGTSIYAQHRVFHAAAENRIKVMLDGQGADELLGGYQGASRRARLISLLRQRRALSALRYLTNLAWRYPELDVRHLATRGWAVAFWAPAGGSVAVNGQGPPWLHSRWYAERDVRVVTIPQSTGPEALRSYLLSATTRTSLPHLLRYEDRNSMAFSVESRVPFLTPQLAEFMLSLPEHYLVDDRGVAKSLFRSAMRGLVPDAILDRTDKVGFTTPIYAWLDEIGGWVQEVLESDTARAVPGLDHARMLEQWQQVRARRRPFGHHIWRWVNFIRWAQRFEPVFE